MELSGNLWERTVTVGNIPGRGFTGLHGNGSLSADGNADVFNWPGLSGGEVVDADGTGFRGGAWWLSSWDLRTSDRNNAANTNMYRYLHFGGRVGRTTP